MAATFPDRGPSTVHAASIPMSDGDGPQSVAADPSTHTVWVVDFTDNSISVIER
jgi:DNA-binding beta-propeller fold protein YncE